MTNNKKLNINFFHIFRQYLRSTFLFCAQYFNTRGGIAKLYALKKHRQFYL